MTAPAFLLVAVILGWPMLQAFYYGMTQWDGITSTWIGPSAYTHEFHDPAFRRVLQNNALLLLSIPLALAIPLGIAFLLDSHVFGWRVFRSAYFLPTAISWVVIGMVSERFFAAQGQLNSLLSAVGLGFLSTNFLAGQRTALLAVALTFVWSMIGTNMIIFLTGMATLDPNLAEAARVDGASGWQTFWRVTVPQLKRFIQFALMMTLISAFTALFSLIFVMTSGGPGYGTTTLEFFVYQTAFEVGQFGTGAMLGVILFVIMATVGIVQVRAAQDGRNERRAAHPSTTCRGRSPSRARCDRPLRTSLLVLVMVVIAIVMLYPFWFMIDTSLHSQTSFLNGGGHSLSAGARSARRCPGRSSSRTRRSSACPRSGSSWSVDARRIRLRQAALSGRVRGLPAVIAALMIPLQSIVIPDYVDMPMVGLIKSYIGAVLMYAAIGTPFATFLMATYYRVSPTS